MQNLVLVSVLEVLRAALKAALRALKALKVLLVQVAVQRVVAAAHHTVALEPVVAFSFSHPLDTGATMVVDTFHQYQ
ncbi:MAG: hypothetical protein AB6733_24705 [Clostridiaceae bacterium]